MQSPITAFIFNPRDKLNTNKYLELKRNLIIEAINFKSGTIDSKIKTTIYNFSNCKESVFYKPGKETQRKKPNIHDMYPTILHNGIEITKK